MNITVLNGSPRGKNSITLQTIYYLEKHFPDHQFRIYPISSRIRTLEQDMSNVLNAMEEADLLLFFYPVYAFSVPSQLLQFIELVRSSGRDFTGKFVTQISTSKHFYDVTAHRCMEENFHDMGLKVLKGFSADMEDLLSPAGREEALKFMRMVFWKISKDYYELPPGRRFKGIRVPATLTEAHEEMQVKSTNYTAVIVTDYEAGDQHLVDMIVRFRRVFPFRTKVVNLRSFGFKGGCVGCLNCVANGNCIYDDGFTDFLRNEVLSGSAIVYACRIRCHSFGWVMKQYDDRQFCNGHRTVAKGKPVGYLIAGDYQHEENLQTIVEAKAQVGGNYLCGIATDEAYTDESIDQMASSLAYILEEGVSEPQNFYGRGGGLIFRDLVYQDRGLMRLDHKFYKKNRLYDFPQNHPSRALKLYLVGMLFRSDRMRKRMHPAIDEAMLEPYKRVIKNNE